MVSLHEWPPQQTSADENPIKQFVLRCGVQGLTYGGT